MLSTRGDGRLRVRVTCVKSESLTLAWLFNRRQFRWVVEEGEERSGRLAPFLFSV